MKKFKIYISTKVIPNTIISSGAYGLYIDFTNIHTMQQFITGAIRGWPIDRAHNIGDLLTEFDTFEELVNNYPELFI